MAPQPASPEDLADYLVHGYWAEDGQRDHRYDASSGQPITFDVSGLSPEGRALALDALQAWSAVLGVRFVEASPGSEGDILIDDVRPGASSSLDYAENGTTDVVRINIGPEWLEENGTEIGSYSYRSFLHEIGHALGLGHTGAYDGSADYATERPFSRTTPGR
jgi:serralysin